MGGDKIAHAIQGTQAFVSAMDAKDWLSWVPFDDSVYVRAQGLKFDTGEKLQAEIRSTTARGGTALYDALAAAFEMIESKRKALGDSVRYGIVILSDGQDTSSRGATLALLEAKLRPSEHDAAGIQIHTIGIGSDAHEIVLNIAKGGGFVLLSRSMLLYSRSDGFPGSDQHGSERGPD
jgi:uncharacterized protein YegL